MLQDLFKFQSIRQFYRKNQFTLFKICDRPVWLGIASILFHYYFCFFIMMNNHVISELENLDYNIKNLRIISIEQETLLRHRSSVLVFLGINVIISLYLIILFVKYLLKPYHNLHQPILSIVIQNYNAFITIPSLYYSFEVLDIFSYSNLPLTFLLGFLSSKHQLKYQIENKDSLATYSPSLDVLNFILFSLYVVSGAVVGKKMVTISYLIVLLFKLYNILAKQTYYNYKISQLDSQLAIASFFWGIIIVISQYTKYIDCLVFWMIVSTPCSFKLTNVYIHYRDKKLKYFFLQLIDDIDWKNDVKLAHFDLYVRNLWQKLNSNETQCIFEDPYTIYYELIIFWHIQSCKKKPFCYCQEVSDISKNNKVKEYLFENKIKQRFLIDYINELYNRFLQYQKNFDFVHFGYLYFLKECSKNEPLLNIKLFEFYKKFKYSMSIQNISTIEYLISIQQKRSNSFNFYDVIKFDESLYSVSQTLLEILELKQDFLKTISEDFIILPDLEKKGVYLCNQRNQLQKILQQLLQINPDSSQLSLLISNFLCSLSFDDSKKQNYFLYFNIHGDIQSSLYFLLTFLDKTKKKRFILFTKYLIKIFLFILMMLFFSFWSEYLQPQLEKILLIFVSEINLNQKIFILKYINYFYQTFREGFYKKPVRHILEDKSIKNAFQKNTSVIFISLLRDEFANIKYVSNSFLPQFQYEKKDILGKNIAIIIPKNIAIQHDKILTNYIERGFFEEQKLSKLQPLYALNHAGFLIQITINLQVTMAGFDQIGVSGLIKVQKESYNNYVVLTDLINQHLVQGCTYKLYKELLQDYTEKPEEVKNIYLTQVLPLLPFIIKQNMLDCDGNDEQNTQQYISSINKNVQMIKSKRIDTIAFLPKGRRPGLSRLFIKPLELDQTIRNGQLSLASNDIYLISFKIQITIDEYLNFGQINFKSFKKIDHLESQIDYIKLIFLEQVKQYCPKLHFTEEEINSSFFMLNTSSQIYNKVNQINDKYSNYHTMIPNQFQMCTSRRNMDHQIQQIQEEQEDTANQTLGQENLMSSQRFFNDQSYNQKDELMFSFFHRNIGSQDHLFNNEKYKNLSSYRNTGLPTLVETPKSPKVYEQHQIQTTAPLTSGIRDLKTNETNVFSTNSLQSTLIHKSLDKQSFEKSKLVNSSLRETKHGNYQFLKRNSQENETNITNQTQRKSKSKESKSQNILQNHQEIDQVMNQIQFLHEQSVSSSRNTQYSTQKKIIKNVFEQKSQHKVFNLILFLAIVAFFAVGFVILSFFFQLDHLFDIQKADFYYIPWGMNLRISTSRILKEHVFEKLSEIKDFGFSDQKEILQPMFSIQKEQRYQYYKEQILEIVQEPLTDIFLIRYITEKEMDVRIFKNDTSSVSITAGIQYSLQLFSLYLSQLTYYDMSDKFDDKIILTNIFNNFLTIVQDLASIQSLQEQNIFNKYDEMGNIVLMLLCVICFISFAFVASTFPVFSFAQKKKQRILSLFSTIDPNRIKQMHKIILISIQSLTTDKNKLSKKQSFITSFQNDVLRHFHIKDNQLFNKKKSISATSFYSRYSIQLIVYCLIIYCILIVYPVVNYFITRALNSQSSSNQILQGLIQTAKAQISSNISTFSLITHADLNLSQDFNEYSTYQTRFFDVLQQNSKIFSQFSSAIQEQQDKGRFNSDDYDTFFFKIITSNACEIFQKNKQYFNTTILTYEKCNTVSKGALKEGLLSAINHYSHFFVNAFEIYQTTDKQKRYDLLIKHVQENQLLQINFLHELIIEFMVGLTKFIVENNTQFFKQMNLIQSILMIYQYIVLVLVYQFGFVRFFNKTTRELRQAQEILTVFEVTYLIENSYIINYLTR